MRPDNLVSYLFPRQVMTTHRERIISGLGGVLAIFLTAWIASHALGPVVMPFMIASMGASTVLLLGAPHSPFSQPWSFVGGHLVSALIGVFCATEVPNFHMAAGLAVGLSITAMYYLRCLHPPGGATALLAVIGDQAIHGMGYGFVLMPVLANVGVLLLAALLINRVVLLRHYPNNLSMPAKAPSPHGEQPPVRLGFTEDDLTAALRSMDGYIDVTGEDLERIYSLAILHAKRRRVGDITVGDIMTREVVTVAPDDSLEAIWKLLRNRGIRGAPVVDGERRLLGMVTVADFLKSANWRLCDTLVRHVRLAVAGRPRNTAERIMTRPLILAREDTHLTDAFLLFAQNHINHLPVVNGDGALVGILTRLDLLASLYGDMASASGDIQPSAA